MCKADWTTNPVRESLSRYAEVFTGLLQGPSCALAEVAELEAAMKGCFHAGGKVMLCGNGGFAAVSQHIAAELMGRMCVRRAPLPALSLATDDSVLTCIANDFGFEKVFSRQIEGIGNRSDVLVALSASGTSKNLLEALSTARRMGIRSFMITGCGRHHEAAELGATMVAVPSTDTDVIQDVAMAVLHQLCKSIERELVDRETANPWDDVMEQARAHDLQTLILDRDGTINELLPNDYVVRPEQLKISKSFLERCEALAHTFRHIFIVTNQACVGKGLASADAIRAVNRALCEAIAAQGGRVDKIYVCTDADSASRDRKPNTGMAEQIVRDFPMVCLAKSLVAGDSYSDELFAQRVGARFINIQNA